MRHEIRHLTRQTDKETEEPESCVFVFKPLTSLLLQRFPAKEGELFFHGCTDVPKRAKQIHVHIMHIQFTNTDKQFGWHSATKAIQHEASPDVPRLHQKMKFANFQNYHRFRILVFFQQSVSLFIAVMSLEVFEFGVICSRTDFSRCVTCQLQWNCDSCGTDWQTLCS